MGDRPSRASPAASPRVRDPVQQHDRAIWRLRQVVDRGERSGILSAGRPVERGKQSYRLTVGDHDVALARDPIAGVNPAGTEDGDFAAAHDGGAEWPAA